jgi:peptide/nickel transport system substrate-binding protein
MMMPTITRRRLVASSLSAGVLAAASRPAFAGAPGVLTIAQSYDPRSLWPNDDTAQEFLNIGNAITESLYWGDPKTGKVLPVLLESFTQLTPTSVRLTVRPGIGFTNGEKLDADAVVASLKVFADAKQTPAYGFFGNAIAGIEKEGDMTAVLHTKTPYPAIALLLAQCYVTPPKYWAEVGADGFRKKPIGTGAYKLVEWVRDNRVVMEPNPQYWGKRAKNVKQLIWRPVPNDTARAAGLQTGEFDIATNLSATAVAQLKGAPGLDVLAVPSFRIYQLLFSTLASEPGPLHDKRVRQALNYAVDKQSIADNLFDGRARLLNGQLLRREQLGYDPSLTDFAFDPAKAKALLREAGFPNGFEIQFKFPSGRYAQDREVAEAIGGMLADVGVKCRMVALEAGEFLNQLNAKQLGPLAMIGSAPADDPDAMMAQYRSTWRYAYIADPALDALIDEGAKEVDSAKRAVIYQKASQLMHDEAYVLFLYQGTDLYGFNKRVSGFDPRGDQRFHLDGMDLA